MKINLKDNIVICPRERDTLNEELESGARKLFNEFDREEENIVKAWQRGEAPNFITGNYMARQREKPFYSRDIFPNRCVTGVCLFPISG